MIRKSISIIFLASFVLLIGKGWHIAKDGFNIRRTGFPLFSKGEWEFSPLSSEEESGVQKALEQKFYYLGRGHQVYAFESEDGRYVLKLPRYDRYRLSFFRRSCPFLCKGSNEEAKKDLSGRFSFLMRSFQLAHDRLKSETGLICAHFHPTSRYRKQVHFYDRLGRSYSFDADRTAFLLQEKKSLMMPVFMDSLLIGDEECARQVIDAYLDLIAVRAERGIFNKDPSFLRNFGFSEGKGIQIDIGSFYEKKLEPGQDPYRESIFQNLQPVREWLELVDQNMLSYFDEGLQERLEK